MPKVIEIFLHGNRASTPKVFTWNIANPQQEVDMYSLLMHGIKFQSIAKFIFK